MEHPCTRSRAISSRSTKERYRPESGSAEDLNVAGGMPPAFRNNRAPTGADMPAAKAASSLVIPFAMPDQNRWSSVRPASGGRPGDGNGARPDRCDRRICMPTAFPCFRCCDDRLNPPWLPWTPFCLSSGNSRGVDFLATLRDEREDLSRKVAFQGSNGVEFGMPFCYPTGNVILGSLVGP
jgi:hypothetical protein